MKDSEVFVQDGWTDNTAEGNPETGPHRRVGALQAPGGRKHCLRNGDTNSVICAENKIGLTNISPYTHRISRWECKGGKGTLGYSVIRNNPQISLTWHTTLIFSLDRFPVAPSTPPGPLSFTSQLVVPGCPDLWQLCISMSVPSCNSRAKA